MLCGIIYMLKLKHLLIKPSMFSPPALESLDSPEPEVFKALSITAAEAEQNTTQAADSSLSSTSSHPQSNEEINSSVGDDRITAVSRSANPHFTLL